MLHNSYLILVRCFSELTPAHAWLQEVLKSTKVTRLHAAVIHTSLMPITKDDLKSQVRATVMKNTVFCPRLREPPLKDLTEYFILI